MLIAWTEAESDSIFAFSNADSVWQTISTAFVKVWFGSNSSLSQILLLETRSTSWSSCISSSISPNSLVAERSHKAATYRLTFSSGLWDLRRNLQHSATTLIFCTKCFSEGPRTTHQPRVRPATPAGLGFACLPCLAIIPYSFALSPYPKDNSHAMHERLLTMACWRPFVPPLCCQRGTICGHASLLSDHRPKTQDCWKVHHVLKVLSPPGNMCVDKNGIYGISYLLSVCCSSSCGWITRGVLAIYFPDSDPEATTPQITLRCDELLNNHRHHLRCLI